MRKRISDTPFSAASPFTTTSQSVVRLRWVERRHSSRTQPFALAGLVLTRNHQSVEVFALFPIPSVKIITANLSARLNQIFMRNYFIGLPLATDAHAEMMNPASHPATRLQP